MDKDRRFRKFIPFREGPLVMMKSENLVDGVDVIVRFHDINRLQELNRAIFSVVTQHYRPINIILCVQRFSEAQIESVLSSLKPILSIEDSPSLVVENFTELVPIDARSTLVNIGFRSAKNRFITFLDYDDLIYPEAYQLLSANLIRTGAAISFASVNVKKIVKFFHFDFAKNSAPPFLGSNLLDLFEMNFCPIHSFMIDKEKISKEFLFFDPVLTKGEDYDFLLKIVSHFKSDFSLIGTIIGSYNYKNDGSNTVIVEHGTNNSLQSAWENSEIFLEGRRRITQLSHEVQEQLGISPPQSSLTVRDLLDAAGRLVPRAPEPVAKRGANIARQIWREFVPYETRAKIARIRAQFR